MTPISLPLDRFHDVAQQASRTFLKPSPGESPEEYHLQQLSPPSIGVWKNDGRSVSYSARPHQMSRTKQSEQNSLSCSVRQDDFAGSLIQGKASTLFDGPPPPISSSIRAEEQFSSSLAYATEFDSESDQLVRMMEGSTGSVMFNQSRAEYSSLSQRSNSAWLQLRRRQRTLENEVQQLLNLQSRRLMLDPSMDLNKNSETGISTPNETFHSQVASISNSPRTSYLLPRAMVRGNVVPVAQSAKSRPPGLRAIRNGLRTAMESLKELCREEKAHIVAAIKERKLALQHLHDLACRRSVILSELTTFDSDSEEPLARELGELSERYNTVDHEISRLEEQLTGLRRQRLWLRDKMRDIRGRREACLSGRRSALRDVDLELNTLIRLPPVLPLDPAIQAECDESLLRDLTPAGGQEFMRLGFEHRNSELAKHWWEAELAVLEKRSLQVDKDQQALDEGSALLANVFALVSSFESNLRDAMKGNPSFKSISYPKGKEETCTEREGISIQFTNMCNALTELEQAMELAESNRWNLLICAIGAELEIFREALSVFNTFLPQQKEDSPSFENTTSTRSIE
ncbi:hypothetical protein E4U36_008389 [Claviceps purpurea]|nr:hypothetical protein E4U36_008389 [Claviceps purpurea]